MIDFATLQDQLRALGVAIWNYLPSLLGATLLLAAGYLFAKLFTRLLQQGVERLGFDKLIAETGMTRALEQAKLTKKPSELLGRIVYWLIMLNLVIIVLRILGLDIIAEPLDQVISYLPQILIALIILVAGIIAAQFMGRVIQAAVASMGVEFSEAVGQLVQFLLIVMVVIISLQVVGLDVTIFTNLIINTFTIIVAGLALAFGLGGRGLAQNVLAGYYAREMFTEGDMILLAEQEGVLIGIGTINCELLVQNERLVLPNTHLTDGQVRIKVMPSQADPAPTD